jgi:hypothetical protein
LTSVLAIVQLWGYECLSFAVLPALKNFQAKLPFFPERQKLSYALHFSPKSIKALAAYHVLHY